MCTCVQRSEDNSTFSKKLNYIFYSYGGVGMWGSEDSLKAVGCLSFHNPGPDGELRCTKGLFQLNRLRIPVYTVL